MAILLTVPKALRPDSAGVRSHVFIGVFRRRSINKHLCRPVYNEIILTKILKTSWCEMTPAYQEQTEASDEL